MDTAKPVWLTEEFLKFSLKDCDNFDGIKIVDYVVNYAVPKGNNYTSDILRVKVDYVKSNPSGDELHSKSIIIKSPITEGGIHNSILQIGILQKEFKIYYQLLPKLAALFDENNEDCVTPKCLPTNRELVIVMDDLNIQGYQLVDRYEQLDFDHSVIVLKNLSKLHAASAKLLEHEPELIDKFGEDLLFNKLRHENEEVFKTTDNLFGKSQLKHLGREIQSWPECKHYADKIFRLMDNVWEIQYELFKINESDFNVFTHGDLWSSNMLFRYGNDGKVDDVIFVDLQIMKHGIPATDLLYFVYSSIKFDVIEKHLEQLLEIYLENLNKKLEKYGSKMRLSEEEFKKSMEEKDIYGFLCSCRVLLFALADKDDIIDLRNEQEGEEENDNVLKKYLKSKKFRSVFPKILDYFSRKSWFKDI